MLEFTGQRYELLDRRGYYRSPVTLSDYRLGRPSPNRGKRFPPEPLSAREVLALMDACGRGPAGIRNRALIVTLWRAGLRAGEALALYPKDVNLAAGTVAVLHGKGDRNRLVGLDDAAAAVIERWLRERRRLELAGRHPLFCVISHPTRGRPLHDAYVRNLLPKLAAKAGIEKRVHAHGLRHTHAFELISEGLPVTVIRRQLGHTSLRVTARYVDHLNPADVVAAIRARPWPGPPPAGAPPAPPPPAPAGGAEAAGA